MPSEIRRGPTGDYQLDDRYGSQRKGFAEEGAKEMARLDDIVEKAGIKPGDLIEILYDDLGSPKWVKPDGTFMAIDNCRVRMKDDTDPNGGYGVSVWEVSDIRKLSSDGA